MFEKRLKLLTRLPTYGSIENDLRIAHPHPSVDGPNQKGPTMGLKDRARNFFRRDNSRPPKGNTGLLEKPDEPIRVKLTPYDQPAHAPRVSPGKPASKSTSRAKPVSNRSGNPKSHGGKRRGRRLVAVGRKTAKTQRMCAPGRKKGRRLSASR